MAKKTTVIEVNEEPEIQLDAGTPELMAEIEAWVKARGAEPKRDKKGNVKPVETEPVTYWDTRNFRYSREGIEIRVKGKGPEYRHDIKTPIDINSRSVVRDAHDVLWRAEHKCKSNTPIPNLAAFNKVATLGDRIRKFLGKPLEMRCDAVLTKAKYDIEAGEGSDHGHIEYSFQTGNMSVMDGKVKSRDLFIIELERRKGSIHALHEEYEDLMKAFGDKGLKVLEIRKVFIGFQLLVPFMDDKQKRCFAEACALNYDGPAQPAQPVPLDPGLRQAA